MEGFLGVCLPGGFLKRVILFGRKCGDRKFESGEKCGPKICM